MTLCNDRYIIPGGSSNRSDPDLPISGVIGLRGKYWQSPVNVRMGTGHAVKLKTGGYI